jgi:hypothetical protein
MLISADEVVQMHERIKACAASSSDAITVLILVAVDTDAVCACAMLTVRLLLHPAARATRRRVRRQANDSSCDAATRAARASPAITARAAGLPPCVPRPLSRACWPHARSQKLLEQDEVSHKVKPVRDYGMLTSIFMHDIVGDGEVGRHRHQTPPCQLPPTTCRRSSSQALNGARWAANLAQATAPVARCSDG